MGRGGPVTTLSLALPFPHKTKSREGIPTTLVRLFLYLYSQ